MLGGINVRLSTIVFAKPSLSVGNKLVESGSSGFAKSSGGSEDPIDNPLLFRFEL